jgi:NADP-dependent 3-hydroxy acid dehydrogenase YdfG
MTDGVLALEGINIDTHAATVAALKATTAKLVRAERRVEELTTALVKLDSVIDFDVPAESDDALMDIRDPSAFNEAIESARRALTPTDEKERGTER